MEPTTTTNSNLFDLQLDPRAQAFLSETAKWAKFVAIVSFCFVGLFLIGLMTAAAITANGPFSTSELEMVGGGVLITVLILLLIIVVIPNIYLLQFGNKMQTALRNNDQPTLLSAFANVKSYFKFIGILYIVVIALWILAYLSKIGSSI